MIVLPMEQSFMRELSIDEMEYVAGGRGLPRQYDSCNDPDGSEIYAVWAQEEAYLDSLKQSQTIRVSVFDYLEFHANDMRGSTPAMARQQSMACWSDPLFVNMTASVDFRNTVTELVGKSQASGWEYGANYYGNGNFSSTWTDRLNDRMLVNWLDMVSWLGHGYADVFIHTHPGVDVRPGLSWQGGDITSAQTLGVGIMVIDMSDPNQLKFYCYNPRND